MLTIIGYINFNFSRCCKSKSGFNHWLLHFFRMNLVLNEFWWTLMNLDEIWWKTMFSSNFIKFHQSPFFFFQNLDFLMNFDEIWWKTMFSPNFIKVQFFFQNLDSFDELWWNLMNLMKTMFSSNFIKVQFYFQSLEFFDEPVKKQINW